MKVAIVELSKSHEECLYSQIQFAIHAKYDVDLILHSALKIQIAHYTHLVGNVSFVTPKKGLFKKLQQAFSLAKLLSKYDKVIFNTASSSKLVRNIALLLNLCKVECVGVLHHTKKLESSFTQSIISTKIKKYYVLNDNLLKNTLPKKELQLQSFYPIYFPNYSNNQEKPKDEIWVTIPGSIDYKRRDYDRLIIAIASNPLIKNLKIVLLGRLDKLTEEGLRMFNAITKNKLENSFIVFEDFVPNAVFHSYMELSNVVMPLLTLNDDYLNHKISGSFNLAFAYKKPLLMHRFFEAIPDIKDNALLYDQKSLYSLLKSLTKGNIKDQKWYDDNKWDFKTQQEKYIRFLSAQPFSSTIE